MHPDISGTSPKETYYLSDKGFDHYNKDKSIDNELSTWCPFLKKNNKIIVEASVCNFYQNNALDYIKTLHGSKVVFILRDPVERFISVYKYLFGKINGIPIDMSLDDFFIGCQKNIFDRDILNYAIDHGQYHKYIRHWNKEVGTERIHVLGARELIKQPDKTLNSIFEFLGLPIQNINKIPHKNKSKVYTFPVLHKIFVDTFGGTIISNGFTRSLYNRLLMKNIDEKELQFKSREQLRSLYEEEYKMYSHLF